MSGQATETPPRPAAAVTLPHFRRLWRERVAHLRRNILVALAMMVLVAGLGALYPAIISRVFDLLAAGDSALIWVIPPVIIAITALKGGAMYAQMRAVHMLALSAMRDLQKAMAAHLIRADLGLVIARPAGDFVSRLLNDVQLVREAIIRLANNLVRDSLTIIAMIGMMLWFDWVLTLLVLVVYPLAMRPILAIGRRQRQRATSLQREMGEATSVLTEIMQSSRMLRAYRLEDTETRRSSRIFDVLFGRVLGLVLGKARIDPILEILGGIAVAGVIALAGRRVAEGAIDTADVAGFITALLMLVQPVRGLGTLNAVTQEAAAALARIHALLDTAPKITSPENPVPLPRENCRGEVGFHDVGFSYGTVAALDGVGFTAAPGQMIAVVGPSGAGKTTLMNLLPRFFDPDSGHISLDGHDLRDLRLEDLRDAIALVGQDTALLDDTIAGNIRLGRLDAGDDAVMAAARAADAHAFITDLPRGYATPVGEGGSRLSGGQKQRIAIARAILKDAPVLLLDEATSALDAESEAAVQKALARLIKGRTTLVVAHRLATVQKADMILVLDKGRIAERGTHAELMRNKRGVYARLAELQLAGK